MNAHSVWVVLSLIPALAFSAPDKLCEDSLAQDKQPDFSEAGLVSTGGVLVTNHSPPKLQLDTALQVLNPEELSLPFDQQVRISYVYESAGANHALGWLYYDDLIARGYIETQGTSDTGDDTFRDSDGDGIADFHADLYNLWAPSANRYIGGTRRCGGPNTFTHGGVTYAEPELAIPGCSTHSYNGSVPLYDARPGQSGNEISTATVGVNPEAFGSTDYSDRGLFPRIPNLLEPRDALNGDQGLGKMVFLLADDDGDTTLWGDLAPVADGASTTDGVPDYDSSAYDANGKPVGAANPNPGITAWDRTVDLGVIQGGREVVFFLVVFYNSSHTQSGGAFQVHPCLQRNAAGQCALHLRTPISVFFSKSWMNLDQNPSTANPAAVRDIGCAYPNECTDTGEPLQGWLDDGTLSRLATSAYGNLVMPHQRQEVLRAGNNMPHVMVGAPATDPFRWILGFEDLNGGGDRDFNDVVFNITRVNGALARSANMSSDLSPDIAEDFTITKVRFRRDDDFTDGSWTELLTGACAAAPPPSIEYQVAVDCRICSGGSCVHNPNPTWIPVTFPSTSPPTQEVELDLLSLGFTGSQLCWSALFRSPNQFCTPAINDLEVGYQAIRAGGYSRSAVSTLANAVVYGTFETPGRNMTPAPTTRAYDGRRDFSLRGHLTFKSFYDPEDPGTPVSTQRWEGGARILQATLLDDSGTTGRRLFTMRGDGTRQELRDEARDDNPASRIFNDARCLMVSGGNYLYDLDQNGDCDHLDRHFFREWLYGWEDRHEPDPSDYARAWVMGGVQHSTPAIIGPPGVPSWFYNASAIEQDAYRLQFAQPLEARPTYAYVGTTAGVLHGFEAGQFSPNDNPCTPETDFRGFFAHETGCSVTRRYGSGNERFGYVPHGILDRLLNHYVQYVPGQFAAGAKVDAPPSVADVDFGGMPQRWQISTEKDQGAKTVLVSATGAGSPTVFALDVTRPDAAGYPIPLWEFSLDSAPLVSLFSDAVLAGSSVTLPDARGSRHSPPIGRMDFGEGGKKWIAAVATDFVPNTNSAGAVYLIDLVTGHPVTISGQPVGVVTLDLNEGVASEPVMVDVDRDGTFDTLYVATTGGRIYRIVPRREVAGGVLGRLLSTCAVIDAQVDLQPDIGLTQAALQRIHSNIAVRLVQGAAGASVRVFFGTGDSPDDATDPRATHYYLLGYEDSNPLSGNCSPIAERLWSKDLPTGEAVWGGVAISGEDVFSATAVGEAADACNLDEAQSGRYYSLEQLPDGTGAATENAGSGVAIDGHATSSPVIHDEHMFLLTADGKVKVRGKGDFNNSPGAPAPQTGVLWWDHGTGMPR